MWMLLFLLALQAQPSLSPEEEAADLFELGVELFNAGDLDGAAAAFNGAEDSGWTSGPLQFNLGTTYLHAGQTGLAVLHLERAKRLMPSNEAVTHNLRIARERTGVSSGQNSWLAAGHLLTQYVPVTAWIVLGLFLNGVLLALLAMRVWSARPSRRINAATAIVLPLTVLALVCAIAVWTSSTKPAAIVVEANVNVHASPTPTSSSRATLQEGSTVRISEEIEGWQEVTASGGVSGWIPADAAERI